MKADKLLEYIKKISPYKKEIKTDTLLFDDGVLNSMNILDLLGYVEKHLERKLKNKEIVMSNFKSAKTIIKVFSKK